MDIINYCPTCILRGCNYITNGTITYDLKFGWPRSFSRCSYDINCPTYFPKPTESPPSSSVAITSTVGHYETTPLKKDEL